MEGRQPVEGGTGASYRASNTESMRRTRAAASAEAAEAGRAANAEQKRRARAASSERADVARAANAERMRRSRAVPSERADEARAADAERKRRARAAKRQADGDKENQSQPKQPAKKRAGPQPLVEQQQQQQQQQQPQPSSMTDELHADLWESLRPDQGPIREFTFDDEVAAAKQFRERLRARLRTAVCAVCSSYHAPSDVRSVAFYDLPHRELLSRDGERTAELPREGLTVCLIDEEAYCLQPAAVTRTTDDDGAWELPVAVFARPVGNACPPGYLAYLSPSPARVPTLLHTGQEHVSLAVCNECRNALKKKKVPPASLLRFDPGSVPRNPATGVPDLPQLTLLEAVHLVRLVPLRPRSDLAHIHCPCFAGRLAARCAGGPEEAQDRAQGKLDCTARPNDASACGIAASKTFVSPSDESLYCHHCDYGILLS
jgi:hypothetical protein